MSLQKPSSQDRRFSRKVLPAAFRNFKSMEKINFKTAIERITEKEQFSEISCEPLTFDNYKLEAIHIKPSNPSSHYIIHCRGNGEFIEDAVNELAHDVELSGCNVIAVNYPGIKQSEPSEFDSRLLVDSQVALVNYLIETHGIIPEHILYKGHSLGAAIATLATVQLHADNKKVYLFNGRGFYDLAAFLAYHEAIDSIDRLPANWAMKVCEAYLSIDENYKMLIAAKDDPTIPLEVSLLSMLTSDKHELDQMMKLCLFTSTYKFVSSHIIPLEYLTNQQEQTAEQVFLDFVKKSFKLEALNQTPSTEPQNIL